MRSARRSDCRRAAVVVWDIAKWLIVIVLAVVIVAVLYYATPNVKQPKFRWISVGALVALVVWALASLAFGFYVVNFSSYNKTYGAIGGVIVFLLWMWISNLALLFGAELDAELERGRQLQAGIEAEETIQLPPRDSRRTEKKEKQHEKDVEEGRRLRETGGQDADADDDPDAKAGAAEAGAEPDAKAGAKPGAEGDTDARSADAGADAGADGSAQSKARAPRRSS